MASLASPSEGEGRSETSSSTPSGSSPLSFSRLPPSQLTRAREASPFSTLKLVRSTRGLTPAGADGLLLDISRVSQLDAWMLDEEALRLLTAQLNTTLQLVLNAVPTSAWSALLGGEPSAATSAVVSLPSRFKSELDMSLRCVFWWFTTRVNGPTPGELMQNLRYRNEARFHAPPSHLPGLLTVAKDHPTRAQRFGHLALTVLLPYVFVKIRDYGLEHRWEEEEEEDSEDETSLVGRAPNWRPTAWRALEWTDKLYRVGLVLNFLSFLGDGRYRSLADRWLRMRLVYARNEASRTLSFDLVNHQLLFDGLTEMLQMLAPLVDWSSLLGWMTRALFAFRKLTTPWVNQALGVLGLASFRLTPIESLEADESSCAACGASPVVMPHRARPCKHVYCYYCVKTASVQVKGQWSCLGCDQAVSSVERV